jgi:crossover junction endodeoxyribonuclease RuvC
MIILGVDPGTLTTGYGVIEATRAGARVLECNVIKNRAERSMPLRLKAIYTVLSDVIDRHHPDEFAIETAFFGKNAQSALKIGHATGVSILSAVTREIPTSEYSPREVKKAVVGNGGASKEQVAAMVKVLLRLRETPRLFDVTDALAVALCHYRRSNRVKGRNRATSSAPKKFDSWKSFIEAHPEKVRRQS